MKRGETKANPTALSPRAVLMLSLTLNPSLLSTERERDREFIHKVSCVVVVKIRVLPVLSGLIRFLQCVS